MKNSIFILVVFIFSTLFAQNNNDLEFLAKYLKDSKITLKDLETTYSCYSFETVMTKGLAQIKDIEKAVKSSRKNTRIAGLLPQITFWGKYNANQKVYLYQQNNISVGKDYITVGPDDNNTTKGNINYYEVGGRIQFDLSKLLYNKDTITFTEQEKKMYYFKMEMINKLSYIYYLNAEVNAIKAKSIAIPLDKMILIEIKLRELSKWFSELTNLDLHSCKK